MAQIQKTYGTGSIMRLGERAEKMTTQVISTGSIALDLALGVGGLPKGRIIEVYGPEAGGKCVSTDTIVFTEHGMLPIGVFGDLFKPGFQKKNLSIYSEGGTATTSHFYNSGFKKTIKIKTAYGYELEATPNHRIRIIDKKGDYVFRRLDKLKEGDRVAIQRGQGYFGQGVNLSNFRYILSRYNNGKEYDAPLTIDSQLAKLMGYLVGDGTCTLTGLSKNTISITIADDEVAADFIEVCLNIFGEEPKVTLDKRSKNTKQFRIHNAKARSFLAYCGLDYNSAADKHIPYSIMQSPKPVVTSFLSAIFETDGCFVTNTIEYCSKSKVLVRQIQTVLLNFGIISRLKTRIVSDKEYFYLYIDGRNDLEIFAQNIGFISIRKQNKLLSYTEKKVSQYQSNCDTLPINRKIQQLMIDYRKGVGTTTREHWDVVYDYLPQTSGFSMLTYPRLNKILKTFISAQTLAIYQHLKEIYSKNIFYDRIVRISPSKSVVVDFTVPSTASFFGNGFINHNTSICLHVIAEAQKKGGVAAFIDAEHALDPQRAQKIGVNLDDLLISQPDTGEQALEIAESLIRSGGIDVLVIDSVAALVPRAELEGEMGDAVMGMQARLMSQALRKLTGAVSNTNTIIIFTNQLRQKIGVMFGNPETTTGGLALKFYSSIRLDVRKIENIKSGDMVVGSRHRVKVVKNKVAPPFRIAEFDMDENGIIHEGEILDVGIELGILTKSGAFLKWGENMLGQGRTAAIDYLKANKKEAEKLEKEIREAWGKQKEGKEKIVVGPQEEEGAGTVEEAV
ncbi:recombinase RecA [Candidatus Daviesbacteria bacterium]|nr:recombinase RecA [Candidatus Daviesbacteria bacterium]